MARGRTGPVGFSLEGDTVKYLELQGGLGGKHRIGIWGLRRFGGEDIPESAEAETPAEELPAEVTAGGPLMQPWTTGVLHKLRRYPVFASLPDSDVLVKFISLPELNESEVARMVELRHREYLPMPRADIVYDFSIARFQLRHGEDEDEEAGAPAGEAELRVMVSGVERGVYLGLREVMGERKVILRSIELNQTALTRACNFLLGSENPGTYAILYLNDVYSMINFVVAGGLYYSRLLEQGLEALTPDQTGMRRLERLLRELYRSVDFFSVESRGIPVETLYLVNGGVAADPAVGLRIQSFLAERLAVNVRLLHEAAAESDRLALPTGILADTLALPLGLALRNSTESGL